MKPVYNFYENYLNNVLDNNFDNILISSININFDLLK